MPAVEARQTLRLDMPRWVGRRASGEVEVSAGEFRYRRRVQFAETDLAGIVHFSVIFRYMEEAEHALWRAAGLTIADPASDIGWPRLAAACQFRNRLHFEEEFDIVVRLADVKRRTLEYEFTLVRGETVIAVGTMTSVCVRKGAGTMKAIEIPADVIEKLQNALV